MSLIHIQEPAKQKAPSAVLFSVGFRPLFAAGSLAGALLMLLWLAIYRGQLSVPGGSIFSWHVHEMIFAYAIAIIAGFLLTAVRNWTNQATANGPLLIALLLLWLLPRPLMILLEPSWALSLLDLAFIPCLAICLAIPIINSRNWKNLLFIPILLAFFVCNVLYHLAIHQQLTIAPTQPLIFALELVLMMITIIGARVMPMFTRNGTGGAVQAKSYPQQPLILLGIGLAQLLLAPWIESTALKSALALLFAASIFHAWIGWQGRALWRKPMIWILHIAYLGLTLTYLLKAAYLQSLLPASAWLHSAAVLCIGVMTVGFMGRVSLGHSGRPLACSRWMLCSYWLMLAAVIARLGATLSPSIVLWDIAAACWSLSLLCFAFEFIPYLCRPRADGKAP